MLSSCCSILYVEDDRDSREMIRLMLNIADRTYEITTAETPLSALELLGEQAVDLYILDYQFAEMSGVELCRRIRQSDSQTPILFYTAMARPADKAEAIAAGATEYLVKPNNLDRLTETIKQLLNQRKKQITCSSALNRRQANHIVDGFR